MLTVTSVLEFKPCILQKCKGFFRLSTISEFIYLLFTLWFSNRIFYLNTALMHLTLTRLTLPFLVFLLVSVSCWVYPISKLPKCILKKPTLVQWFLRVRICICICICRVCIRWCRRGRRGDAVIGVNEFGVFEDDVTLFVRQRSEICMIGKKKKGGEADGC